MVRRGMNWKVMYCIEERKKVSHVFATWLSVYFTVK